MRKQRGGGTGRLRPEVENGGPAFAQLAICRHGGQLALPHGHEILGQIFVHAP
jgi:hypothetical protein